MILNDVIFQDLPTCRFFFKCMPVVGKEITDMSGTFQSDRYFGHKDPVGPMAKWSTGVPHGLQETPGMECYIYR